ncbi:MAG: O-antigen ligase family protein [Coriobacteriia bacterium]|jgi:O-antigen ligase|nr:O-antigen ligase family protein [Coriobacteriia bacterium]
MTARKRRVPWPAALAAAGVAVLVFAVALYEGRFVIGPIPLDAVSLTVPLALLACVPFARSRGRALITDTGLVGPALVFLGFALISVVAAGLTPETFLTFSRYLSYVLLVGALALVTRDPFARRFVMWAVAIAGTATVAYGGWWYVTTLLEVRAAAHGSAAPSMALRVVSTFQNANFYGEFLVLLIAVTGYLAVTERRIGRWVAVAMGLGAVVMLLLTYTRGSWLGLIVASAGVALCIAPRRAWVVIAAPLLAAMLSPSVQARLLSLRTIDGSAAFRLRLWRIAGAVILSSPLTGTGIGTFYQAFTEAVQRDPSLSVGFEFYGAHNSYFTLLAETGVFGGFAFMVLIFTVLRIAVRALLDGTRTVQMRLEIGTIAAGLGAFALNALTSNSFQHPQAAVFFWLLAGVLVGVVAGPPDSERDEREPAAASAAPRPARAWASIAATSLTVQAGHRVAEVLLAWWLSSATRKMLVRPPARDGEWVSSSRVAQLVLGGRPR